jgi:hypothetical protein
MPRTVTLSVPTKRVDQIKKYLGLEKRAASKDDTILKGCNAMSDCIRIDELKGLRFIVKAERVDGDLDNEYAKHAYDFGPMVTDLSPMFKCISGTGRCHPAIHGQKQSSVDDDQWERIVNRHAEKALVVSFFGMLPYASIVHEDPDHGFLIIEVKDREGLEPSDEAIIPLFSNVEQQNMYVSIGILNFPAKSE